MHPRFCAEIKQISNDKEGRNIQLDIQTAGVNFLLSNIYAPNTDDMQFVNETFLKMLATDLTEYVVVGDFNCVMDVDKDRKGSRFNHNRVCEFLNNALDTFELCDIWRVLNPNKCEYTWFRTNPSRHFARLDYFLISDSLCSRVNHVRHTPGFATDHSAVTLSLKTDTPVKGKGFWKLNVKHLSDKVYITEINEVIEKAASKYKDCNPALRWEMIKCEIVGYSMLFSITKAKKKKEMLNNLNRTLKYLETLRVNNTNPNIQEEYEAVKAKIDSFMKEKTQSLIFMSRANYYQEGERNTKYFYATAKKRAQQRTMYEVNDANNKLVKDPKAILKVQHDYYNALYKQDKKVNFRLKNDTGKKVTDIENLILEEPITLDELKKAVDLFPPAKTPGCDGLPAMLYQCLWNSIGMYFHGAINYGLQRGVLHMSATRGYLMLIPKKHRNLLEVKNWRPLVMLSMDYKIHSKALDLRFKKCLESIIEDYQTSFMEGRNILINIIKVMDIMEWSMHRKLNNLIMSIDFEKCFDMISHSAIKGAFRFFNFSQTFTDWVMTLFTDFQICAYNNGNISDWFYPSRGVHQGCCISPHIFNLTGQIFANILHNNDQIDAVMVNGIFMLMVQFADDTSLFLKANERSVRETTRSLVLAEQHLGLRINYQKTVMYRIGSLIHTNAKYYTTAEYHWNDPPDSNVGGGCGFRP